MNISRPKVSVIMATYNRAHLIQESLEAIINQTFNDWECLIIDDGSTDDTADKVNFHQCRDERIRYLMRSTQHKKGLPGCRNQGLDIARGEYIVFLDDDDIPHPLLLELSVKEITAFKADFCRYQRAIFHGSFQKKFHKDRSYEIEKINIEDLGAVITGKLPFNSCQVLWKADCFSEQRYCENLMYAEEWELYTRILGEGKKGISIEKVLFYGRKHPASNTGEFKNNDPVRRISKIKATKLIISYLAPRGLIKPDLENFFLRLGFDLKSYEIIEETLRAGGAGSVKKFSYKYGFMFYPFLKPFFTLKGKIKGFGEM